MLLGTQNGIQVQVPVHHHEIDTTLMQRLLPRSFWASTEGLSSMASRQGGQQSSSRKMAIPCHMYMYIYIYTHIYTQYMYRFSFHGNCFPVLFAFFAVCSLIVTSLKDISYAETLVAFLQL